MIEIAELDKLCIICLNTETLTLITQLKYQEIPAQTLLKDSNLIKFENEDLNNQRLCWRCCKLLYSFYCMRKQFIKSQEIFKSLLKNEVNIKNIKIPKINQPNSNKCVECVCSNVTALNLPTICRICFQKTDIQPIGNLTINEKSAIKLYEEFSNQNIQSDELLCLTCLKHLTDISNFRNKFENHDFIAQNIRNGQTSLKLGPEQTNYPEIIDNKLEIVRNELTNEQTHTETLNKNECTIQQNKRFTRIALTAQNLQNGQTDLKMEPNQTNYELIEEKIEIVPNELIDEETQTKTVKQIEKTRIQPKRKTKTDSLNNKIACRHCPLTFDTKAEFTQHTSETKTHRSFRIQMPNDANIYKLRKQPFECKMCSRRFSLKRTLDRHLFTHATDHRPFACDRCGAKFIQKSSLAEHMHSHHNKASFTCEVCGRVFAILRLFQNHKTVHENVTKKPKFVCKTCGAAFMKKSALYGHRQRHGEKLKVCSVCDRGFYKADHLTEHMRCHTGEEPYKCDVCSKAFKTLSHLKRHLKTHTETKRYKCETCGGCFAQPHLLQTHVRRHTGEKPYACEVCRKRFTTLASWKDHLRIHTGEKPFKCEVCSKVFRLSAGLKIHKRTHKIKCENVDN